MQSVGNNSLNRREMLRLGAAGAGGLLLSSAASSQGLGPSILTQPMAPLPAVKPVAAAPASPLGIDPALYQRAKAALDSHRIAARDSMGIVDFSLASRDPRFHLINLASGQIESFRVAHGRGSDPDHSGFVEMFSNRPGSEATSNGTYTTGDYYHGKYGLSMKVHGLDWTNNNAENRAIVVHNAWYAEPEMIDIHGKLGRSEGCFAFSRSDQWKVMSKLAGGRMIFADKIVT
jgi:hypothetical protein